MQCVLCGGPTAVRLVTAEMVHRGTTYVMRDVPAEVCERCGEPYFELATYDEMAAEAAERWARG